MKKILARYATPLGVLLVCVASTQTAHAYIDQGIKVCTVAHLPPIFSKTQGWIPDTLNVRNKPGGRIVNDLQQGATVVILDQSNGWSYIWSGSLTSDFPVGNGWVATRYLNNCFYSKEAE